MVRQRRDYYSPSVNVYGLEGREKEDRGMVDDGGMNRPLPVSHDVHLSPVGPESLEVAQPKRGLEKTRREGQKEGESGRKRARGKEEEREIARDEGSVPRRPERIKPTERDLISL